MPTATEKRALSQPELELVQQTHYPQICELPASALADAARRLRARLRVVALGALLADDLAELSLADRRDEPRREEDADEQRGAARDQDLTHAAAAPR